MILSGVLGTGKLATGDDLAPDDMWSSVALLLAMNGEDGATSFNDLAGNVVSNKIGTVYVSPAGKYKGCAVFPASATQSQRLVIAGLSLGSNFTIEFWVKFTDAGTGFYIVSEGSVSSPMSAMVEVNKTGAQINFGSGSWGVGEWYPPIPVGEWVHCAFCVSGGSSFTAYVNGVLVRSRVTEACHTSAFDLSIGRGSGSAEFYVDDFRITKALRYTGNFTPPSALA